MTMVTAKYPGTKLYDQVYAKLKEVAQDGGTINYGEIGKIMGISVSVR